MPQAAEDIAFLACGPLGLGWGDAPAGAGAAQSLTGTVTEAGDTARSCVCASVRLCAERPPLVSANNGAEPSRIGGICDRMGLHIHCASRTVLEAQLFLSLRISGSSALIRYLPIGIAKLLLGFIFKLSSSFNNLMAPRIFKWILNRPSDSPYSIFKWFQIIFKCSSTGILIFLNFINFFI